MAYVKYTSISGWDAVGSFPEPRPDPEQHEAFNAWASRMSAHTTAHLKSYSLRGHWSLDTAIRYARQHGIPAEVKIEHQTSDTSGKGRGGIDRRWTVDAAGAATQVPISREEDEGFGEEEADFLRDAYDEHDNRD